MLVDTRSEGLINDDSESEELAIGDTATAGNDTETTYDTDSDSGSDADSDSDADECNTAKMDNGDWTKKMIKEGTWGNWIWDGKWEPGSSVVVTWIEQLAGSPTYQIAGRSNGVKIDAVRIYLEGTTSAAAF